MTAFGHALGFLQHNARNFYVALSLLIESGSNNLSLYATRHIGNLFGAFVNQQYQQLNFRMIFRNGIGNVFQQHRLTRFGLRHDHSALAFTNGRE